MSRSIFSHSGSAKRVQSRNFLKHFPKAFCLFLAVWMTFGVSQSALSQVGCGTPAGAGRDGSPTGGLSGIVNSYFVPNASVTAGSNSIVLASRRSGTSYGDTIPTSDIAAGDLLLVIQMQFADITTTDDPPGAFFANGTAAPGGGSPTGTYGDGTAANNPTNSGWNDGANGNSALAASPGPSAGLYEYVRVTAVSSAPNTFPLTVTIQSTGTGNGLVNNYTQAAFGTAGQRTYQVIRVPQYGSVGVGSGTPAGGAFPSSLTCAAWDGSTGGVLAMDVQSVLSFTRTVSGSPVNGLIDVSGRGFRGGGGQGNGGDGTISSPTYRSSASNAVHANKGEGIVGTPRFVYNPDANTVIDTGVEGYPSGSRGRGAPGNAGGGGNDSNPGSNDQNSGGGGGGNCGFGGRGGNCWSSQTQGGGFGGASLSNSVNRVFMGGGGGAGTRNNSSGNQSGGGTGGGIVLVRCDSIAGTGTINANGAGRGVTGSTPIPYNYPTAYLTNITPANDGSGGGGAGGTVLLTARSASTHTLTINVRGGDGFNNFIGTNNPHGAGGGGGGGVSLLNSLVTATTNANGGLFGQTGPSSNAGTDGLQFDAQSGTSGTCNSTTITRTSIPGVSPGSDCTPPVLTEVKLQNFEAVSYSNGEVGLSWNTGFEADNLGFRVWREVNGKRELVTGNGLVAGSALMAGTTLTAGNRYTWRDGAITRGKAGTTVSYWLEDIDLNGKSSWNGPFELKTSKEPMPESLRNAPLLGRNNPVFGSQTTKSLNSADPMELNRAIAESATVQTAAKSGKSSAFQQTLAAGPAVKLGVRTTGWQNVSRSALVGAGLNPSAVDANLKMYVNGSEVPIRVSANSVEFYGVAADTLQSGEQTYWLVEGNSAGLRIPTAPFGAGSRLGAVSFASLVERRDRTTYFAALQNGDADNFFGAVVSNAAVDQALTVKNRDANATFPAQVAVTLQGVSLNSHRVSVKLNGATLGEVTYNGRDQQTFTTTVAQSQIQEGQNTVTLQSADGSDVNLVAAVRISYARSFVADADALSLSGRAGQTLTVRGFSQAPRVFDVTDPANPVEVAVRADGASTGNVSASFVAPGAAGSSRQLVATTASRFLTPTVTSNTPSTLSASSNAADFVILTTPELAPALTPLVQLRQSQGLTVKVVDVADVYDEFSFGVKSAQAIKDFLNLASHNWQTPVRYAMFAGDASFDPRDFLGFNQEVIPTKLLGLGSLETASDDWFGDFNDSGLSEIAIGRLPGRTQAEINAMVSKIVAYDQARGQAWQRDAVIIADNNDDGGNFESAADSVEAALPGSFAKTSVKVGQIGGAAARTQLLSALNEGKGFVNYLGHGSVSNWAAENVLTSGDVAGLGNQGRAGLVVDMACLNGFFHDVYSESLAKSLVRANGKGAAAAWASTSLTTSPGQQEMNLEFTRTIFGTQETRLGDAIRQAKTATFDLTARRSWVLLGDPTMKIVR